MVANHRATCSMVLLRSDPSSMNISIGRSRGHPCPIHFHFHAVFGIDRPCNRLVPPSGVGALSGKSWILH